MDLKQQVTALFYVNGFYLKETNIGLLPFGSCPISKGLESRNTVLFSGLDQAIEWITGQVK